MALDVGCRARFKFGGHRMEGTVGGIAAKNCVWFLPDAMFDIPDNWERSKENPRAFATLIKHLTPLEHTDDILDISPDELDGILIGV